MDIRKIALYLSGKLPPDYVKFNRLEFMEYLSEIFGFGFDRLDFYWKQAKEYEEEFYFLVLDYLFSKGQKDENEKIKFDQLLRRLNLSDDVLDREKKVEVVDNDKDWRGDYTWDDFKQKIIEKYGKGNYDKGEIFEELCEDILKNYGFRNTNISSRGSDSGVDIVGDKEVFVGTGIGKFLRFVGQCKYKDGKSSVSLSEAEELTSLLVREGSDVYQGAFFFTNTKYQSRALVMLNNTKKSRLNMETFVLDGAALLDIINSNKSIYNKYLPNKRP